MIIIISYFRLFCSCHTQLTLLIATVPSSSLVVDESININEDHCVIVHSAVEEWFARTPIIKARDRHAVDCGRTKRRSAEPVSSVAVSSFSPCHLVSSFWVRSWVRSGSCVFTSQFTSDFHANFYANETNISARSESRV